MWVLVVQSCVHREGASSANVSCTRAELSWARDWTGRCGCWWYRALCLEGGRPSANTCTQAEVSRWSPVHSRFSGPQSL